MTQQNIIISSISTGVSKVKYKRNQLRLAKC